MKKIVIVLMFLSSFMIGCQSEEIIVDNENLDKVDKQINSVIEDNNIDYEYFIEISAQEFSDKVNSDTTHIFFIGRDTCPACRTFKPTAIEFSSKEKTIIYYVNTTDFEASDWSIIDNIVNVEYIPTIVISKNSKILYNEHGVKSYGVLKSIVEEYFE